MCIVSMDSDRFKGQYSVQTNVYKIIKYAKLSLDGKCLKYEKKKKKKTALNR